MAKANVNDRASIEQVYDKALFEQDAARNSRSDTALIHGLKILSAVDGDGAVELARASQNVGEAQGDTDSIFLAAHRDRVTAAEDGNSYAGSVTPSADAGNDNGDYGRFIDEVVDAVRNARFQPSIGRGEDRLKGLRGG